MSQVAQNFEDYRGGDSTKALKKATSRGQRKRSLTDGQLASHWSRLPSQHTGRKGAQFPPCNARWPTRSRRHCSIRLAGVSSTRKRSTSMPTDQSSASRLMVETPHTESPSWTKTTKKSTASIHRTKQEQGQSAPSNTSNNTSGSGKVKVRFTQLEPRKSSSGCMELEIKI